MSVVDRVKKLLSLSQRAGSPEEAALAATRAQELIAEHRLAEADLALSGGEALPEEAVVENVIEGDHSRRRAQQWRIKLASALAGAFKCRVFYYQGSDRIAVIGRESDVQTIQYLQGYIALEIQRLTEEAWREIKADTDRELPQPARWRNSFRLGVVSTVRERLLPAKPVKYQAADEPPDLDVPVTPSAAQALVLARDVEAQAKIDARWKHHFPRERSGSGPRWSGPSLGDGWSAGRAAGHRLDLDRRSKGAISGSKPRIEG